MRLGMMTETFKRYVSQEESLRLIKELGFDVADITLFKTGDYTKPDPDIFDGDYILRAKQIKKYADEKVDNLEAMTSMVDPNKMLEAMNDVAAVQRNMFLLSQKLCSTCYAINAKAARYQRKEINE